MEFRVWWDWDSNPERPWSYSIQFMEFYTEGCCASLHECNVKAEQFIFLGSCTQDNTPQSRYLS